MSLDDCRIIDIPTADNFHPGSLGLIDSQSTVPFDIKRISYLFDVPSGDGCAGSANKTTTSLVIALRGSFDVLLDDGQRKQSHFLNLPTRGILIPPMVWKQFTNFSSGSVCMVFTSALTSEDDEIVHYGEFLDAVSG